MEKYLKDAYNNNNEKQLGNKLFHLRLVEND